ncbi:uncharacterized protein [Leptinotarsa decemlineata]|uniref:uncharacterized protein n=1 Tax=Leptinotarsa decemlineata TaxID=7539 RepID=UPI003D30D4AF
MLCCNLPYITRKTQYAELFEIFRNALCFTEDIRESANKEVKEVIRYGKIFKGLFTLLTSINCYYILQTVFTHVEDHYFIWIFHEYFPELVTFIKILYFCNAFVVGFYITSVSLNVAYIISHVTVQQKLVSDTINHLCDGFEPNITLNDDMEYQKIIEDRLHSCIRRILWIRRRIADINTLIKTDICLHSIVAIIIGITVIILFNMVLKKQDRSELLLLISYPVQICIIAFGAITGGQGIMEQDETILKNLYGCPWYTWNSKNKKTFLLLMTITGKPAGIYFTTNIALNNVLYLSILKGIYTFGAVMV